LDCDSSQTPILLIHGFCGSSNNWLYHIQRLREAGYKNIFTINLGSPFRSIDDYACRVKHMVAKIQGLLPEHPGIALVGHSMGGLVARHYRYTYADAQHENVQKIFTIGTPLDGTYLAYLASWISPAARQMEPGSSYVQQQQQFARCDDTTKYVHIGTNVDSIVVPGSSALKGGSQHIKTAVLDATGHVEYLFSDATADLLIDELPFSTASGVHC
jgi:triacylglycerol esterase/lipase EstA (alpha/beta hydrolase family)